MDPARVVDELLAELELVAQSEPNERMPKEEQIRCCVYAAIRPLFDVVCVERGYASIDQGSRIECDLWARRDGEPPVWIEFKRCWDIVSPGWVTKPAEQKSSWKADLTKMRGIAVASERHFLLVGVFSFDPLGDVLSRRSGLVQNIREFHPQNLVHKAGGEFRWPNGEAIEYAAAWAWRWRPGEVIDGA
jgi:hypothetical protein